MGTFVVLARKVENLPVAVTVHIAEAAINKENKDSDRSCL